MNVHADDECELIGRAQAGEAIAFERLAWLHAARLWRCALALGKDGHWAEDLAQETLFEAWRSLRAFRRPLPVLHLAVRHSAASVLEGMAKPEHRGAFCNRCSSPRACTECTPDRSAETSEDARRVRQAVADLPEEHRLVVELRFFAGATLDEIAAALGCPLGTVKSRLHYGLEKLRHKNLAVNLFTSLRGNKGEQIMNDLHHPCEPWAEQISLAAAGCLSPDEEPEVRRHIETCSDCREHFRQLTELCGALVEARLPADGTATAIVERVMSAVASEPSQLGPLSLWERVRVRANSVKDMPSPPAPLRAPTEGWSGEGSLSDARAEMIHPMLLTRSLDTLEVDHAFPSFPRCGGGHFRSRHYWSRLVVPRRRRDVCLRRLRQPILEAKTAKYKITSEMKGTPRATHGGSHGA